MDLKLTRPSRWGGASLPATRWFFLGATLFVWSTSVFLRTAGGSLPDPSANWSFFRGTAFGGSTLPAIQCDLNAVYAISEKDVWIAGNNLFIAHSTDGGVTWKKAQVDVGTPPAHPLVESAPVPAVPHENLVGLELFARAGWAVGSAGGVYALRNGGNVWRYEGRLRQISGPVTSATYTRQGRWLVANGKTFSVVPAEEDLRLEETKTPPAGEVDGVGGSFNRPADRGPSNAVAYGSRLVGWRVANQGLVFRTTDGGKTWHALTRPFTFNEASAAAVFPVLPSWYFLVNGFSVYALLRGRSMYKKVWAGRPREWIEPKGETDRPLDLDDVEASNLMPLAKTLADFLRNLETKPPLTIAVTGTWGSGKSSLMNLVRGQLMKAGWRPVWFNAWHHQKEESLLAALLQTIRMQAVPKIWSRGGPSFYARLLWIRLRDYRAQFIALLMLTCFSAGLYAGYPLLVENFASHGKDGHDLPTLIVDLIPPGVARLFFLVTSVVSIVYSLVKALSAFGVKPAQLLTHVSSGAKVRDLEKQTSFRERFSREFHEVTEALNPKRSMLIFIDDLDRCRPENVVDVLEAVNFLVSSGECFVILGMARDKVEPAVGLAFEKMAAEMVTSDDKAAARAARADLARQYLDKLINIEVPVPRMSKEECLEALTREQKAQQQRNWWQVEPLRVASLALMTTILTLLPVGMGLIGIELATAAYVVQVSHAVTARKATGVTPAGGAAFEMPATSTGGAPVRIDPASLSSDQPARIIEAGVVHDRLMYLPAYAMLLLLLWIVWWMVTSAQEEVVRDSDEFTAALKIWHPFLYEQLGTPRALKRFKNRVRFMALRARARPDLTLRESAIVAIAATRLKYPHVAAASQDDAMLHHIDTFGYVDLDFAEPFFDDFFAQATFN